MPQDESLHGGQCHNGERQGRRLPVLEVRKECDGIMDEDYLEKQIEFKRNNDEDKYMGKALIITFLIVVFVGIIMMSDRSDNLVSLFLLVFGSLGMGYIFGFERGKKVER